MATGLRQHELGKIATFISQSGVDLEGPLRAEHLAPGRSNLTFRLTDGENSWVLRMPPRHGRTPSAHDVGREFRVTRALGNVGFPVPRAIAFHEDDDILGVPCSVSEFVEGETIQTLDQLEVLSNEQAAAACSSLVEQLAALHAVDVDDAGLRDFGPPRGYVERQIKRWSGQWDLVGNSKLALLAENVIANMRRGASDHETVRVVHGDYRIDNTLLELSGTPTVIAVVDWELSTLGDPIADVAMMCAYRDPAFDLVLGFPTAWASSRLPAPDELAAAYERTSGRSLERWSFHRGLAQFKIAVIAAGIDHRARADNGSSVAGEAVEPFLQQSLASLREAP